MLLYQDRQPAIFDRLEVHRLALPMIRDGGWFGFGPESFEAAFVSYQDAAGQPTGRWYFAHQDYLQALIEWGWGGALAWAFIILGGFWKAARDFLRTPRSVTADEKWIRYATFLALAGVLLHAGFDFPLEIDSIRLYVLVFLALAWNENQDGRFVERNPATSALENRGHKGNPESWT
jgi:O-antigen ligase